ncbi:hypothetical protein N7509_001198 [Penicillium cosmopolitanum]|uniref:Uncharacterized protein n=1 Tax=Penicillium cosmopolitanum TaxID=1131564 RepID=A0A9X0BES7_9EURO|nr:uncharacterized protein N7509_001198 [Penicillium cosmopolitanum]KAJ5414571.1 hypothetical protein N7509_001198 [Penicillium cosmopolitanum]
MRYAYTFPAVFAAAVIAAPLENAKRSDDFSDLIGDVGIGAILGGNGDATGVKNAKRDDEALIGLLDDDDYENYEDDDLLDNLLKRDDESLIGNDGYDKHLLDVSNVGVLKRDDEDLVGGGSVAGILKRSEDGLAGDVGVAAVAAGDGSATGVQNAKRDDELLVGLVGGGGTSGGGSLLKRDDKSLIGGNGESNDYNNNHLADVGVLGVLKRSDREFIGSDGYHDDGDLADLLDAGLAERSEEGIIGDVGVGAVAGGDGDATGVKNAKREDGILSTDLAGVVNILKPRSEEGLAGDVGVAAVLAGDGSATGLKKDKRQLDGSILGGVGLDLREGGDDSTDGANINEKRSEDIGVDGLNLVPGGVADYVQSGTPILGIANPR